MRRRHRWRRLLYWVSALTLAFVLLCNRWVINSTDAYIYTNWALLPENDVGIVLGTSTFTREGESNPQFYGRIQAAVLLYNNGKVKHLILSGANPDSTYNEPKQMQKELLKLGIPAKDMTLDPAGDNTRDSMLRAARVFGLDRVTIITQRYHSYRAVFYGKKLGLRVAAFVAPATTDGRYGSRNPPREIFARVKAVLDLVVLRTNPPVTEGTTPIDLEKNPPAEETSS